MANKTEWKVVPGAGGKMGFVSGDNLVRASCHHKGDGACGGCYARLMAFVERIGASPADAERFECELTDELHREGEALR